MSEQDGNRDGGQNNAVNRRLFLQTSASLSVGSAAGLSIQTANAQAADGPTVYAGSSDNTLYAVDVATGEQEWTFSEPSDNVSSPTVVDGTVYVGSSDETLYAVDAATGEQEWEFSEPSHWVPRSPTVVDGTVHVGSFDNTLYAVDAETGERKWTFTRASDHLPTSPAVVDGTVYVGSFDNTLYAVDAETGEREWAFTEPSGPLQSSPTVADGTVYVGSRDDSLYAVDTETGEQEWAFTEPSDWVRSSPTVVDETVYVGSSDGTLYAVDVATGEQEWAVTIAVANVRSSPTVDEGTVYVQGDESEGKNVAGVLYAIDAETGEEEWTFTGPSTDGESSPTVADGTVYFGSNEYDGETFSGTLYAVDADTGEQEWAFTGPADGVRSPTVVDDPANGDSIDSRVNLGTLGHHHVWADKQSGGPSSNSPPTADFFVSPENPEVGEEFALDGSPSSDPDGSIESYDWDIDDDGEYEYSETVLEPLVADEAQEYPVTLRVTDNDGATDTETTGVTVTEPGGGLELTADGDVTTPGENATVEFTLTNTGTETAEDRGVQLDDVGIAFDWDLVDADPDVGEFFESNRVWENFDVEGGESQTLAVTFEAPGDVATGEYDVVAYELKQPDVEATATIKIEESGLSVQPTDLRLVQTAEHTRREQYEDIVSRSALETEGALPAWAPDTELVAEKETVPVFDLELSETETDSSLETAIDVSVSWGQSGADNQSFTLRPEFVSDVLDPTTTVSSVLDAFVNPLLQPGADGETYPVAELPADRSDVEVTVSPHSDDISGKTASLTDVSAVGTGSLNIGMVLLSDTEDATEYDEVDVDEFEQKAAKQRDAIEQFFPASTVNVQILTEPVALRGNRLRELLPYWDYRERHQRLAWEYAREELGEAIDAVVAFSPPNFLSDNSEAGGKGVTTVGECEQAVLVDMGLSDTTTAAHELTHYFLDTYTAETEYEAEDDDGSSDGAHMASDIVSTTVETPDTGGIPLDNGPVEFDNFETPNSYMQSSSLSSANQDTITAQALLDNGKNGGFTCAWGTPDETAESVVSVSASVTADGIDVHSTRKSDVLSPSTDPDGDAEATIRDANGETIDSLSLSTTAPEAYVMGGDGNCCTSSAAQDETIVRGQIPFPEEAASIVLTAPNPDSADDEVSTRVNPVTETFREEITALPDAAFASGVNPGAARQSYLDGLDSAESALDDPDYEAARDHFEDLRGQIQTEVRGSYDPPAGVPSQQDLLGEIDDRLARIDRLERDDETDPDDPTVADYANEDGVVDIDGLRAAIDDFTDGEIRIDLLRAVIDAFVSGEPVE